MESVRQRWTMTDYEYLEPGPNVECLQPPELIFDLLSNGKNFCDPPLSLILFRMFLRWVRRVAVEIESSPAISEFDKPLIAKFITSISLFPSPNDL